MPDFILHTVPSSPYGRAVALMLEEKEADWALERMAFGDSKSADHLLLQPFGRLPVLRHGDLTLYETQAILRYLDQVLDGSSLSPSAPHLAARMNQLIGINDHYLFPGCANVIVFQRIVAPVVTGHPPDVAAIARAMPHAHVVFGELSRILGRARYLAGADLTLADLMIAPQLSLFSRTPEWSELVAGRENLAAWLARMEQRPSMRATRPAPPPV